jgi:hypothetical protein
MENSNDSGGIPEQQLTPVRTKLSLGDRITKFISLLDVIKKLLVNFLLIAGSVFLIIFLYKSLKKKRLLIHPMAVSAALISKGYSGEVLTERLIEKIKSIQTVGSKYYLARDQVLPSWDDEVNEITNTVSGSTSGIVKLIFGFLDRNAKMGSGEITSDGNSASIRFRIDDNPSTTANVVDYSRDKDIDSLLAVAAEYTVRKINPYLLAGYYLQTRRKEECLEVVQSILNGDNSDSQSIGFAENLRGVVYMYDKPDLSRDMFYKAIRDVKNPWLSYSNLGVLYSSRNKEDSARMMLLKSIDLEKNQFYAYLNFGNLLYIKYVRWNHDSLLLDSAIDLYNKAIENGKDKVDLYAAKLPALYDKGLLDEGEACFLKCVEMAHDDCIPYLQMGMISNKRKKYQEAIDYFVLAQKYCVDSNLMVQIRVNEKVADDSLKLVVNK